MESEVEGVTSGVSSLLFYSLIATSVVLYVAHYYQQQSRRRRLTSKIPGPPELPFIGHALYGLSSPEAIFRVANSMKDKYGSVVKAWLGPRLFVFLTDPRDIELILGSQVHLKKSSEYRFFKPWLGDGLLISYGEKWRTHRKLIAPTFHLNVLKSFVELFNKNSRNAVARMEKEVGHSFDVHEHMGAVTVDILMETAMGIKKTKHNDTEIDYATAVMRMCDIIHQRQYKVWLRLDSIFKMSKYSEMQNKLLNIIHNVTNTVIKEKKKAYSEKGSSAIINPEKELKQAKPNVQNEENDRSPFLLKDDLDEDDVGEKKRMAFLDLMLEAQKETSLTDEEIKEEVDTIMFEGHDTTAAGASFVLSLLGIHHDIQEKVHKELDEIFGDSDRFCTHQDTVQMKYLERVIMESLRLYPPVPIIAREIKQDLKLVSINEVVPEGTTVIVATYAVHRKKEFYGENADKFNPDNFLPEAMANRHYYSYIPFSAGPRSCVGRKYAMLKLKVLLSTILRNYRVNSPLGEKEFRLIADIILKRKEGFQIILEKRREKLTA